MHQGMYTSVCCGCLCVCVCVFWNTETKFLTISAYRTITNFLRIQSHSLDPLWMQLERVCLPVARTHTRKPSLPCIGKAEYDLFMCLLPHRLLERKREHRGSMTHSLCTGAVVVGAAVLSVRGQGRQRQARERERERVRKPEDGECNFVFFPCMQENLK